MRALSPRLVSPLTGIILLLSLFGCKSIKKVKTDRTESYATMMMSAALDSTVMAIQIERTDEELAETIEEIRQSFTPMDSSGFVVFKPVTVTLRTTKVSKTSQSKEDSTDTRVISSSQNQTSDSSSSSISLDKASESEEVIGQVVDKIFPKWGKILASILMAVVPVVWGLWKKRNQAE
jgi:uncharacterized protein (UPF0335 family)